MHTLDINQKVNSNMQEKQNSAKIMSYSSPYIENLDSVIRKNCDPL